MHVGNVCRGSGGTHGLRWICVVSLLPPAAFTIRKSVTIPIKAERNDDFLHMFFVGKMSCRRSGGFLPAAHPGDAFSIPFPSM